MKSGYGELVVIGLSILSGPFPWIAYGMGIVVIGCFVVIVVDAVRHVRIGNP